jgi:hypothetical protein
MTLRIRRFAPVLLLAGGLGLAVGVGPVFDEALAEAGGNGKGIGQGGARGGANSGGGPAASAQGLAKGSTKNSFQANSLGRLNSLIHASNSAWQNAKGNSPMGILSGEYKTALQMFGTLEATELPTIQDLGAILAKVANKDEVSPEAIDLIHQRMIEAGVITNEELEAASASLAPSSAPSLDATAPAPTFAELLTEQANLVQASQATQGLGSIY